MPDLRVPRAPGGLGKAGKALWRSILADLELESHEVAILSAAARQADNITDLEALLTSEGLSVVGSAGQPVLNKAVTELRLGRLALAKLLSSLDIPAEGQTGRSRDAARAAKYRWNKRDRQRAALDRQFEVIEGDG